MTPEEMQRTMEFLLAQQARFDTRLEKLFESHERLERSVMELRESVGGLHESHVALTSSVLRVVGLVEELAKAQMATDGRLKATDERLRATDERLNVLINVVEKHITGPDHRRRAPRK